jgi:hypothetical protein
MPLVRCEVTGALPIVDAVTGADVAKGNPVQLDDERTNIAALEQAGLVRRLPAKAEKGKG